MSHQRGFPIGKSSKKTGIARTVDRGITSAHHTRTFVFQTYAEDDEFDDDFRSDVSASSHFPMSSAARNSYVALPALRDKRLLEEVYEQVALQDHLDTRDLHLNVNNGVVVIAGSVSDEAMKAEIASFVRRCPSVKNVIDCIATPSAPMQSE